jgi:beta-lactamase regulating signal transducer with metallopeptidase domain
LSLRSLSRAEGIDEEKITQPLRQRIIELEQMLGEAQKQLTESADVQTRILAGIMSEADSSNNTVVIALVLLLVGLAIGFGAAFYVFEQRVKRRFRWTKGLVNEDRKLECEFSARSPAACTGLAGIRTS